MSDIADVIKLVNKETEREDLSEEIKQYLFCDLRHKLWKMDTIMLEDTFRIKEYSTPDGKRAIFEYDHDGVGKITLEAMDALMGMITDRPSEEWIRDGHHIRCKECGTYFCDTDREGDPYPQNFCPHCGARMFAKDINVLNKEGADDEAN